MSIRHHAACRLLIALLFLTSAAPTVSAAQDDWDLGLRTGLYTDGEDPFVGFEALARIRDTRFMGRFVWSAWPAASRSVSM